MLYGLSGVDSWGLARDLREKALISAPVWRRALAPLPMVPLHSGARVRTLGGVTCPARAQRQPPCGIRSNRTTPRLDAQNWTRFAAAALIPCPGAFVPLQRLTHALAADLGAPFIELTALRSALRAAGWGDRVVASFFGPLRVVGLADYRLATDPSPAEFLTKIVTPQPGARIQFARVVAAFNTFAAGAGLPFGFDRVRTILAGAAPDLRIARGIGRTVFLYGHRFAGERTPQLYAKERLVADADALTPIAHIAADFNSWWGEDPAWSVSRVGKLLSSIGLRAAGVDYCGHHNISTLRGWRLVSDPPLAAFFAKLERAPGQAVSLDDVTAAFNAAAPGGLAWSARRMSDQLRARGFPLALKRRAGGNRIFVDGYRLSGDTTSAAVIEDLSDLALPHLDASRLQRLARAGVKTRDALADLDAGELRDIVGLDLTPAAAEKVIMAARAHWFAAAEAAA